MIEMVFGSFFLYGVLHSVSPLVALIWFGVSVTATTLLMVKTVPSQKQKGGGPKTPVYRTWYSSPQGWRTTPEPGAHYHRVDNSSGW